MRKWLWGFGVTAVMVTLFVAALVWYNPLLMFGVPVAGLVGMLVEPRG